MTVGPVVSGAGLLLLSRVGPDADYLAAILPGAVLLGLGLSLTVAPLTTTVLASADDRLAGLASGVNNAVARTSGLLAVAILPLLAGLTGDAYRDPAAFDGAYRVVMLVCAGLLLLGAGVAWATVSSDVLARPAGRPTRDTAPLCRSHCAVGAPPLEPAHDRATGAERRTPLEAG
jgi:hypothetical protein